MGYQTVNNHQLKLKISRATTLEHGVVDPAVPIQFPVLAPTVTEQECTGQAIVCILKANQNCGMGCASWTNVLPGVVTGATYSLSIDKGRVDVHHQDYWMPPSVYALVGQDALQLRDGQLFAL